jgi:hypothetical protein
MERGRLASWSAETVAFAFSTHNTFRDQTAHATTPNRTHRGNGLSGVFVYFDLSIFSIDINLDTTAICCKSRRMAFCFSSSILEFSASWLHPHRSYWRY